MKKWQGAVIALACVSALGFSGCAGTESDTDKALKGQYKEAVEDGYTGSYSEWLDKIITERGAQGPQGETGAQGAQGEAGKSAYDVAVENGYEGTYEDWVAGVKLQASLINDIFYETNKDAIIAMTMDNYFAHTNVSYTETTSTDATTYSVANEKLMISSQSQTLDASSTIYKINGQLYSFNKISNFKYKATSVPGGIGTNTTLALDILKSAIGVDSQTVDEFTNALKTYNFEVVNAKLKIQIPVSSGDSGSYNTLVIDCKNQEVVSFTTADSVNTLTYGQVVIPEIVESEFKTTEEIIKNSINSLYNGDYRISYVKDSDTQTFTALNGDFEEAKNGAVVQFYDSSESKTYTVATQTWQTVEQTPENLKTLRNMYIAQLFLNVDSFTDDDLNAITVDPLLRLDSSENKVNITLTIASKSIIISYDINTNALLGTTDSSNSFTSTISYTELSFIDMDYSGYTEKTE